MDTFIPASFEYRRSTFTEKLKLGLSGIYSFVGVQKEGTLLIPCNHVKNCQTQHDTSNQNQCESEMSEELSKQIAEVAQKIRNDISQCPTHQGLEVDAESVQKCLPASLLQLLRHISSVLVTRQLKPATVGGKS